MPTIKDYVDAIDSAKKSGTKISIDFSAIPEGIDKNLIAINLHRGLPDEYKTPILDAAKTNNITNLDFSQVKDLKFAPEIKAPYNIDVSQSPLKEGWEAFSGSFMKPIRDTFSIFMGWPELLTGKTKLGQPSQAFQQYMKDAQFEDNYVKELEKKQPLMSTTGGVAGGIASLAILSGVPSQIVFTGVSSIGGFLATSAVRNAITFAMQKGLEQAGKGEIKPGEIAKSSGYGAALGVLGGIPQPLYRIAAMGGFGFTTAKMEGATDREALINGAIFVGIGMLNREDLSQKYKNLAFQNLKTELTDYLVKEKGQTPEVASAKSQAFVNYIVGESKGKVSINDLDLLKNAIRNKWKVEFGTKPAAPAQLTTEQPMPTAEVAKAPIEPVAGAPAVPVVAKVPEAGITGLPTEQIEALPPQVKSYIANLEKEVSTDELTGLISQKQFHKEYNQIQKSGAVSSIDINNLGAINNTQGLGHPAGNELIKTFGTAAKEVSAKAEYADLGVKIYRSGGDEFTLVSNNPAMTEKITKDLQNRFNSAIIYIETESGRKFEIKGGLDYGTGKDIEGAEQVLSSVKNAPEYWAKFGTPGYLNEIRPDKKIPYILTSREGKRFFEPAPAEGITPQAEKPAEILPAVASPVEKPVIEKPIKKEPIQKIKPAEVKPASKEKQPIVFTNKQEVLAQIQNAIKTAPEIEMKDEAYPAGTPKITLKVGSASFDIYNTKAALQEFYDRVKSTPEKIAPEKTGLVTPRPTAARTEQIGELVKVPSGYFTDTHILIKGDIPARAKYGEREITDVKQLENILNAKTEPATLSHYQFVDKDYGQGYSQEPIAKMPGKENTVFALFKSGGKDYAYNQFQFNAIRNRFPDAVYGVDKNGILIASQDNKPVAALMPVKDIKSILEVEELQNKLETEAENAKTTIAEISSGYNELEKSEILSNIEEEGRGAKPTIQERGAGSQAKVGGPVQAGAVSKSEASSQPGVKKEPGIIEEPQEFEGTRPIREVEELAAKVPDSINNGDEYETYLSDEIDETKAQNVLLNLANTLGVKIRFTATSKNWGVTKTRDGLEYWIVLDQINNIGTLVHEMGHILSFRFAGEIRGLNNFAPRELLDSVCDYINIPFAKDIEKNLRKELNDVSHYIEDYDEKSHPGYTRYRHRASELTQMGYQLLLTQPQRLQQIAPTFFNHIKKNVFPTELFKKMIGREFDANTPFLPQKQEERENIAIPFLKAFDKVLPDEGVKVEKPNNIILDESKKVRFFLSLPLWSGINNPKFEAVYGPFKDADYEYKGLVEDEFDDNQKYIDILKLPKVAKTHIANALYSGNLRGNNKVWTLEEAKKAFGITEEEYKQYREIKKLSDRITYYTVEARKEATGFYELSAEEQKAKQEEINAMIQKYKGYIPLTRTEGDWVIYGDIQTPEIKSPRPYFTRFEDKNEAIKMANLLAKAGYKNLTVYPFKNLPASFYDNFRHFSIDEIDSLLNEVKSNMPNIKTDINVINKFISNAEDFVRKSKGYSNLMKREYVSGYDWTVENALKTIVDRLERSIKKYTNTKAFHKSTMSLKEINPKIEPQLYDAAKKYIDNYNSMSDDELRIFRRGIATYVLSFRISLILQDILSPLKTTYSEIANYIPEGKIELSFLSSLPKTMQYLFFKSAPADMMPYLKRANKEGLTSAPYTESLYGEATRKKQFFELSNMEKTGLLLTQFAESFGKIGETYRRTNAMINALQIAKNLNVPEGEVYNFAKAFVEKTQGRFGTLNLAPVINQTGILKPAVKTAILFKQYVWHEFQYFLNKIMGGKIGAGGKILPGGVETKGKMGAALRYTIMSFLLTGFMGFSFAYLIDLMLKKLFGIDIRSNVRKALGKDQQAVADMLIYGMPTLTGANLSRMIGMGDFIQPSRDPLDPFLGAGYGQAKRILQAIGYFQQGNPQKGILTLTPQQIANPFLAYQMSKEGLQVGGVKSKAPISREDILFKAGGITSTAIAKEYERMDAERAIIANKNAKSKKFTQRLINAEYSKNWEERKKIYQEVKEYNDTLPDERFKERIRINRGYVAKRVYEKRRGIRRPSRYETDEIYGIR
jgi:GGDEF domain-containing protein